MARLNVDCAGRGRICLQDAARLHRLAVGSRHGRRARVGLRICVSGGLRVGTRCMRRTGLATAILTAIATGRVSRDIMAMVLTIHCVRKCLGCRWRDETGRCAEGGNSKTEHGYSPYVSRL